MRRPSTRASRAPSPGRARDRERRRLRSRALAVAMAWALQAVAAAAGESWPVLPAPAGAREFWIAPQAEQNGIAMRIRGFESAIDLERVMAFYRRWLADKEAVTVQPRGDGWLLGATVASYRLTVHLEPGLAHDVAPAVTGTLTVARLDPAGRAVDWRVEAARELPLPPGTTLVSSTVSEDEGRRNRTLVAVNRHGIGTNTLHLREHLLARGWRVVEERTVVPGRSAVLVMRTAPRASAREAVITIVRQDRGMFILASVTGDPAAAAWP